MGSGIEDFFGQIPPGMIIVFCGSGILLLGVIAYGLWSRARRRRLAAEAPPTDVIVNMESAAEVQPIMNTMNTDLPPMDMDEDLPDLDILSHPGEDASPSPSPVPVPLTQPLKYAAPAPTPIIDEDTTPPPAPVRPSAAYRVMLNSGETADAVEVLTVLRDVADGSLIIQIGSQSYRHPAVDADADFMRRLNGALRDLNAGASAPTGSAPAPAPRPAAPPAASSSGPSGTSASSAVPPQPPPRPAVTSTGTTQAVTPTLPGDLPKFRIEDQPPMTGRRGPKGPKIEIPEINIGASIEAFLQHKRAQNGDFAGRHIHVRNGLGGAIVIEVDGQFFDAVSDVKDAAVRAYLQETIEEWQARQ